MVVQKKTVPRAHSKAKERWLKAIQFVIIRIEVARTTAMLEALDARKRNNTPPPHLPPTHLPPTFENALFFKAHALTLMDSLIYPLVYLVHMHSNTPIIHLLTLTLTHPFNPPLTLTHPNSLNSPRLTHPTPPHPNPPLSLSH